MKIRIFQNSLRFRLNRHEVQQLAQGTALESTLRLTPQCLRIELATRRNAADFSASFDAGVLIVSVPIQLVQKWAATGQVGMESVVTDRSQDRQPLHLLIEKDFKCLHDETDNQEDCFANPRA